MLVLLDGVPLNDPTDLEGGAVNLSSLPISSVQRIEVARGPVSYFYGSTALSGVVNIVTRRGTIDRPQVRATVEGGGSGTAVRGTVSRAFKLPSFFALASPPQLGGNPELRPETSVGVDVGIDQRVDGWNLTASFTVFWIRYEDLIDFDFDLFQNVNRDEVNARGVEFSLRWSPMPRVHVFSDLTYQSAESPGSVAPLRNLPEWMGSVRVGFEPVEPLQIRVEWSAASDSFDVQIAVPGMTMVDGYGILDMAATWDLHPSWQILARVDNLTDTDYEHFIGFPQPGITAKPVIQAVPERIGTTAL